MKRKWLVVGIILLFIGTAIVPSIQSEVIYEKNIITVDDEPGDADFTSIKEAVNHSSPGDTIEVYSGTYKEQEIHLEKDKLNLLGIAHELGAGDDSGKPYITGKGNYQGSIIRVLASDLTISNFTVENTAPGSNYSHCIHIGTYDWNVLYNITIEDCEIYNSSKKEGILVYHYGEIWNTKILDNYLNHSLGICCSEGLSCVEHNTIITGNIVTDSATGILLSGLNGTISGNEIINCSGIGILLRGYGNKISGNKIKDCDIGIQVERASRDLVTRNDIDRCPVGLRNMGNEITITENNFKHYSRFSVWFERMYGDQFQESLKNHWVGNYWGTLRVGPKMIFGLQGIPVGMEGCLIFPGVDFDWKPAKKPYNIPGTT